MIGRQLFYYPVKSKFHYILSLDMSDDTQEKAVKSSVMCEKIRKIGNHILLRDRFTIKIVDPFNTQMCHSTVMSQTLKPVGLLIKALNDEIIVLTKDKEYY